MGIAELVFIAIGLSMDAFAVSICKGLEMKKINISASLTIALFFGGFQALMPFVGWVLGTQFQKYIDSFDHWIAFFLLLYIGGKMIKESVQNSEREVSVSYRIDYNELFILAVATSMDALAVGITIAFLKSNILLSCAVIGIVTFIMSILGVQVGAKFGGRFEKEAGIVGGIILSLIGLKILLEHFM